MTAQTTITPETTDIDHEKAMAKQAKEKPDRSLSDVLATVLDDEDDALPCLACHL